MQLATSRIHLRGNTSYRGLTRGAKGRNFKTISFFNVKIEVATGTGHTPQSSHKQISVRHKNRNKNSHFKKIKSHLFISINYKVWYQVSQI